jgi:hypothetical protein
VRSSVRRSFPAALILSLGLLAGASSAAVAATTTANVFVVPSGGSSPCTRQATPSDFGSAASSAKCSTIQAAVSAMGGGDTAIVKSGTYANASINGVTKTPAVTVTVEPGGTANIGGTTWVGTSGVVLDGTEGANGQGFSTSSGFTVGSNGGAAVQNFRISGALIHDASGGATLYMTGCNSVTISHLEIRDVTNADGIQMAKFNGQNECTNVTFDDIYMHDFNARCGVDHQDGIQIRAGSNITFANSRIFKLNNCGSQGFFANQEGDLGGSNTTLSNTVIAGINGNAINFSSNPPQKMYNNTIDGGLNTCQPVTSTCNGVIMKNNILNSSCAGQALYHNRVQNSADWANNVSTSNCGYGSQGDTVTPSFSGMFASPGSPNYNYHLVAGAFAVGKATKTDFTAVDFEGDTRDSAPDAGADEQGTGGTTPPPPAPADTTAPTTTISAGTSGSTTATTASFTFTGSDDTTPAASLTFECSFDGAVFAACTSPMSYSGVAIGSHTFAVRAKDAAGNVDASPGTSSWTVTTALPPVDTTAPTTTISSGTSGSTTATTASFTFTGSDNATAAGSLAFECKLDSGAFTSCASPKAYNGLAVGSHTFSVRAKDAAGNVDGSPATASWTVPAPPPADTTAPDTTITSTPANPTTDTGASFAFAGADDTTPAGSLTFQCSLDNAAYAACSSPKSYAGLAVGAHSLRIRAKDAASNVDASAASFTWTIAAPDRITPDTAITAEPPATTTSTSAQFAFKGSDDVTGPDALTFECQLDSGPWAACTSPVTYTGLGLLGHGFAVRATDAAGNVDGSPAKTAWTVLGLALPPVGVPPVTSPTPPDSGVLPSDPAVPPVLSGAPHVMLTAPNAGGTFTRSLNLAATATAVGGAMVKRVEFWMDGTRIARDRSAPYAANWSVPSRLATGLHTLSARVYDSAGRVASTAVTVTKAATTRTSSMAKSAAAAQLTATEQSGGTDLTGATRASSTVVASLVPCSGTSTKKTKVTLKAVGGRLTGHRDGRLCVVGLAPAA